MTQINVKEKTTMDMPELKTVHVSKRTNWTMVAVLGCVAFTLVLGATVAGIFVGKSMTKDIYEEAWATYHNTATNITMKQRYIIDGHEVSIIKPGEISVVLDYERGHVVMQVDGMRLQQTNDCLCFVYDYDNSKMMDPKELEKNIHGGHIEEQGSFPVKETLLEISEKLLSPSTLSKRSIELCDGCKILQASVNEKNDEEGIKIRKRRNEEWVVTSSYYFSGSAMESDSSMNNKLKVDNFAASSFERSIQAEVFMVGPVQVGFTDYKDFFSYSSDVNN